MDPMRAGHKTQSKRNNTMMSTLRNWACAVCTYENPSGAAQCGMCGCKRSSEGAAKRGCEARTHGDLGCDTTSERKRSLNESATGGYTTHEEFCEQHQADLDNAKKQMDAWLTEYKNRPYVPPGQREKYERILKEITRLSEGPPCAEQYSRMTDGSGPGVAAPAPVKRTKRAAARTFNAPRFKLATCVVEGICRRQNHSDPGMVCDLCNEERKVLSL